MFRARSADEVPLDKDASPGAQLLAEVKAKLAGGWVHHSSCVPPVDWFDLHCPNPWSGSTLTRRVLKDVLSGGVRSGLRSGL